MDERLEWERPETPGTWAWALGTTALALLVALLLERDLKMGVMLMGLPVVAGVAYALWRWPVLGLHFMLAAGFGAAGLNRYRLAPAPGLMVDFSLTATLAVVVVQEVRRRDFSRVKHPANLLVVVWLLYNVLELLNPQPISIMAWFYAGRGVAFYMLVIPLGTHLLRTRRQLMALVVHWALWAVVMAGWGIKQSHFGVTRVEQAWLNAGAYRTHVLHGKLRAFSLMSDTAQFGITMAYSSFFFAVMALVPQRGRYRLIWGALSAICFYGMMVSGTRSALAAIPVGVFAFAVVSRRWRLAVPSVLVILTFLGVLKYTSLGQGVYAVQRMRQAVNPLDDPSFQVRLANQRKLWPYLLEHPMGGGVGSAGYWGLRFTPDTFLANLALDSYYVKLAADQGLVGFFYFMVMIFWFLARGFFNQPKVLDVQLSFGVAGAHGVVSGVLVASYSNQYLGQLPTGVIVYVSMAVLLAAPSISAEEQQREAAS